MAIYISWNWRCTRVLHCKRNNNPTVIHIDNEYIYSDMKKISSQKHEIMCENEILSQAMESITAITSMNI